ncbi:MAG: hypothetical protein ACJ75B_20395 [Flavisolibacter sp.]
MPIAEKKGADKGQQQFRSFNSFADKNYGKGKLKALFENKHITDKDIKERIDQGGSNITNKRKRILKLRNLKKKKQV